MYHKLICNWSLSSLVAAFTPGDPTTAGSPGCQQQESSVSQSWDRRGPVWGCCYRSYWICWSVSILCTHLWIQMPSHKSNYITITYVSHSNHPLCVTLGPTVLEVFNTLLRQLRQSVDYQLTGYYDNAGQHKTSSSEEKTLQDAVIKTIGGTQSVSGLLSFFFIFFLSWLPHWNLLFIQDPLPTRFPSTRGQRSCCSS